MKFCQPHWDRLRAAIEARGLNHLVASNGRDAMARAVADIKGESDVSDFDPLMTAHWMIVGKVQESLGLSLYCGEAICPVCEILKDYPSVPAGFRYKDNESYFIDGPADAVLVMARDLGIDKPEPSL